MGREEAVASVVLAERAAPVDEPRGTGVGDASDAVHSLRETAESLLSERFPVILGPVPCKACRRPVTLRPRLGRGPVWEDSFGIVHYCYPEKQRCACGGLLRVPYGDDPGPVIRVHQGGPLHTAWRMGLRYQKVPGTWQGDGLPVATVE